MWYCLGPACGFEEHLTPTPNPPPGPPPYPTPFSVVVSSAVEVSQLLEAGAPVVEVVVVLVPCAGGVEGADGADRRAAALVVKHQEGVIGRGRGVIVCRPQTLEGGRRE